MFTRLQARAKGFMYDPKFPERSACVAFRDNAETAMLFEHVRVFLEEEGWGERLFSGQNRKLKWPEEKEELVGCSRN